MKIVKYIIIGVLFILLASCGEKTINHDASGIFEANEIVVSAEVTGKILEFNVEEGMNLQKDQLVGYIDSMQLYLRKKQLQKNIRAVRSRQPEIHKQIAVIEQQILTQKKEKQRIESLLLANAATQKQLDDINAQITLLEKQLEAQKSSLNVTSKGIIGDVLTLEVQIEQIDDQLKKCKIVNQIDGTVLVKYTEVNELALPGKALYKIADLENMIFRAYITSSQLTKLKIDQNVRVFADFGEETREYEGKVVWISNKSEFTPKTIQTKDERDNLVYAIKIAVKNDGFLKIGMYGEIDLKIE